MIGELSGFGKIEERSLLNRTQGGFQNVVGTAQETAPAAPKAPEPKTGQAPAGSDRLALSGEMREAQQGGDFARLKTILADIMKQAEGRGSHRADQKSQAGIDTKESAPASSFLPFVSQGQDVAQGEIMGFLPGVDHLEDSNTGRPLKLGKDGALKSPGDATVNYAHGGGDIRQGQVVYSEINKESNLHTSYFLP